MSNPAKVVADDQVVSLEYVVRLDDGQVVGRSPKDEPLEFLQGQGEILPGLETALYGMEIGQHRQLELSPAEAYGEYDPEDFVEVPRDSIPQDVNLVEGEALLVSDSENEEVYQAIIAKINPDSVILDLNHPLAGSALHFDIKIVGLRPASAEELSHGHVHKTGHEH